MAGKNSLGTGTTTAEGMKKETAGIPAATGMTADPGAAPVSETTAATGKTNLASRKVNSAKLHR